MFGVDAIAIGDVNADGLTDYVVTATGRSFAGTGPGEVFVIAGTPLPCPADLNGNHRVGFGDFVRLLRYVRDGDLRGDLNGDRTVDQVDIRVLFADLGRCTSERRRRR